MSIDWTKAAAEFFAEQPHPQAPGLKVKEYATAVRLATAMRFGGHAPAHEAEAFWREFTAMNDRLALQKKMPITPEEFEHVVKPMAQVSFAYHGRPPTMHEIARHRDSDPKQVHDWYANLPDEHYPHVPAGGMVKYLTLAEPHARMNLGRKPNKVEASRFYHGNFTADAIDSYYRRMKEEDDRGGEDPTAGHAPGVGATPTR